MQFLINKRLIKPFIVLLTAFNILPVGLLSVANMDILKVAMLCILILSAIKFRGYFERDARYTTFFLLSILLSAVNMVSKGKYMDWTLFYCLNYLNFYLLFCSLKKIQDIKDYIGVLLLLCVLATCVQAVFYLFPALLDSAFGEIRMGSINLDAAKIRVFIPGMGFIALVFTYLISKLLYYKKLKLYEVFLTIVFFISIFILASVRTYLLGILVALVVLLMLKKLSLKRIGTFAGVALISLLLLSLFSANIYEFVVKRFDIFLKIGDFSLVDAIRLDVDYDNEQTFGTVYFRIMEVMFVLQNFSNDVKSIIFGNLGTLYDFLGVEQETAPHVSIFGIYYLFGLVGLGTFLLFFIYHTRIIIGNLKKFRNSELEFLSIVLAIFWFSLFVFSFFGGIYYSEMALIISFTAVSSILLNKQTSYERIEN